MTPEQMRALLSRADEYATPQQHQPKNEPVYVLVRDLSAALRAAADQLEAVQGWADHADPVYADMSELYAILTADTAPQEDRDE